MSASALQAYLGGLPDELLDAALAGRGAGVKVAVVDSGIDVGHKDLRAKVTRSCAVATGPRGPTMVETAAPDVAGHGTACADVIGRLAPDCELWNVRALGPDCKGSAQVLLAALRWCIEQGADVVNLSLGTRDPVLAEPLRELVDLAYRKSIMVVAAASNIPNVRSYPAVFASLVCVDSAYFESPDDFVFSVGDDAEIDAPGVYVDAAWPGGGRRLVSGTSFACPHIAGHLARIISVNRGLTPFQIKTVLHALGKRNAVRLAAKQAAQEVAQ